MSTQDKPSEWQKNIEGRWYGTPTVFDADGNCVGRIKVDRASVFENGRTTYYMDTKLDVNGPLRSRFEAQKFAFGVLDSDRDRIYMGPDFLGAGHPFGSLVDANYYSPAWMADLRTLVYVSADGKSQVYSSQLYEGPTLIAVFNGLYQMATDYDDNDETRARIDAFIASERESGNTPHVLPMKTAGSWRGELSVYDADQQSIGTAKVELDYRPTTLLRASCDLRVSGAVEMRASYGRSRINNRHMYEGPDIYGNGIAYGRALYTTQHFVGKALKIRGREFLIDDDNTLNVAWRTYASDKALHVLYGNLTWHPGEDVLTANYSAGQP